MPPAANMPWNPARKAPSSLPWRPLAHQYCLQPLTCFFDTVAAQTLILFCKQFARACETCRRSTRRNTDDDRYFLVRDPPGSIEEQWEGISFRQVCESTLNMLSFGNLRNASTMR